jgi:hypothetical protein
MFSTTIHSSQSHRGLQATYPNLSEDKKIITTEKDRAPSSKLVPNLPEEVIEKILYFLVTPYESVKSIFNLNIAQRINKSFYESAKRFLKISSLNYIKNAEKDIAFLKEMKNIEN